MGAPVCAASRPRSSSRPSCSARSSSKISRSLHVLPALGEVNLLQGLGLAAQAVFFDQRGGQRFFDIRCGGKCSTHTLGQVRAAHALCLRIHRHQWRGRGALYRQHYGIHHLPCRECAAHFAEEQIFAPDFQLLKGIRIVEIGQN